jgi:hypothetical protein
MNQAVIVLCTEIEEPFGAFSHASRCSCFLERIFLHKEHIFGVIGCGGVNRIIGTGNRSKSCACWVIVARG